MSVTICYELFQNCLLQNFGEKHYIANRSVVTRNKVLSQLFSNGLIIAIFQAAAKIPCSSEMLMIFGKMVPQPVGLF